MRFLVLPNFQHLQLWLAGKLHCKLFRGALGHATQAGDPPSLSVGLEEASVTTLGGHGGTQARQAGPQEPHGPQMQGRTRHHWHCLSYSTTFGPASCWDTIIQSIALHGFMAKCVRRNTLTSELCFPMPISPLENGVTQILCKYCLYRLILKHICHLGVYLQREHT